MTYGCCSRTVNQTFQPLFAVRPPAREVSPPRLIDRLARSQVISIFFGEKETFRRERASGAYRVRRAFAPPASGLSTLRRQVSSFFLAKNLSEFPVQAVMPFITVLVSYFLIGAQRSHARPQTTDTGIAAAQACRAMRTASSPSTPSFCAPT